MSLPIAHQAAQVLRHYAATFEPQQVRTPERPGFSDALVLKVETAGGPLALRRWPKQGFPDARVQGLHRLLRHLKDEGLTFVAPPIANVAGQTVTIVGGARWQVEPWLPGQADFHAQPTDERLSSVMHALARWHRLAACFVTRPEFAAWFAVANAAPSPAVAERLSRLEEWTAGGTGEHTRRAAARLEPARRRIVTDFLDAVDGRLADLRQQLHRASNQYVRVQPCLRDVWHDHLLFTGDAVSGIVDPTASRGDHVAVDLARLLGSLLRDDAPRWEQACRWYQEHAPLDEQGLQLMRLLDRSGVVLSGLNWLQRMYVDRAVSDRDARVWNRFLEFAGRLVSLDA